MPNRRELIKRALTGTDKQRACVALFENVKRTLNIAGVVNPYNNQLLSDLLCRLLYCTELSLCIRESGGRQHCNYRRGRYEFSQKLKPLWSQERAEKYHPRTVAARSVDIGHQAVPDWVAPVTKTIGTVVVLDTATRAEALLATITATGWRINSAISNCNRSI
jgi:hypothetical protein